MNGSTNLPRSAKHRQLEKPAIVVIGEAPLISTNLSVDVSPNPTHIPRTRFVGKLGHGYGWPSCSLRYSALRPKLVYKRPAEKGLTVDHYWEISYGLELLGLAL